MIWRLAEWLSCSGVPISMRCWPTPRPFPSRGDPGRGEDSSALSGPQRQIDSAGSVTLRHNSRLHHIGLGAGRAGTRITLLVDNLHIQLIGRDTGVLIRELILDATRDYQPRGLPPGPPKNEELKCRRCPKTPAYGVPRHNSGAPGRNRTYDRQIRNSP